MISQNQVIVARATHRAEKCDRNNHHLTQNLLNNAARVDDNEIKGLNDPQKTEDEGLRRLEALCVSILG